MVQLAAGTLQHRQFVNVFGLSELRYIDAAPDVVTLGGSDDVLGRAAQRDAAEPSSRCSAGPRPRPAGSPTRTAAPSPATSPTRSPAADTPPALLVYDAELELASVRGRRVVPYDRFHTGYKQMDLAPDELIVAIRLPRTAGWIQHYRKVGARRAQAISKVCFAAAARLGTGPDCRRPARVRQRRADRGPGGQDRSASARKQPGSRNVRHSRCRRSTPNSHRSTTSARRRATARRVAGESVDRVRRATALMTSRAPESSGRRGSCTSTSSLVRR